MFQVENHISSIKVERFQGDDIPNELAALTLGDIGMMFYWLKEDKHNMRASLLKVNGQIVAWACSVEMFPNTFGVGTFVAENMRGHGFGKSVLSDMLQELGCARPNAVVRFGAESERFNALYLDLIKNNGLIPNHCYGSLWTEQRKAA